MLWREDTRTIYVLVKDDQATGVSQVYVHPDTWAEPLSPVAPQCAGIVAPQDVPPATDPSRALQVPIRGFGKVWCNEKLQSSMGFGNGKEVGIPLVIQETAGGLYVAVQPGDGRETVVLFFLDLERALGLAP